jgi:penicillin-binding protein 2
VLIGFGLLAARFIFLQVVQHDHYASRAEDNRISIVPIAPNRGLILDRNGIVMARNYSGYTLEIFPRKVRSIERTIDEVAELVEITSRDRARFKKLLAETRNAESLPIRTRLSDEEVAKFAANRYRYNGTVEIKARLFRQYPYDETAAHVMGYMGRINTADQQRLEEEGVDANYRGTDFIGKAGVEASYQNELHGTTGFEHVEIDAAGRGIRTLSRTPSQPGNNVALTLDLRLQQVAEQALGERRGAVVALEPVDRRGARVRVQAGLRSELLRRRHRPGVLGGAQQLPRPAALQPAIAGTYPPGSTFKPFMALAALETGKRTPRSAINDPGYFVFGDRRFRDSKPGGNGYVDLHKSIVVSSDTYYYHARERHGHRRHRRLHEELRLRREDRHRPAGRVAGVLPSPEWKMKRFRRPEQQKWYPGETISIGIGQGYNSYTPIQLAQAVATLANGGTLYRPHLVAYIDNPRTGERRNFEPEVVHRVGARADHIEFVKRAMAGSTRKAPGRAPSPERSTQRRQDRHGAGGGVEAEREVRREEGRRAPPRPFLVHCLRAAREPEDRARHHRRERRLRRARRGADRAHHVRLLPPRQAAAGLVVQTPRTRWTKKSGRATDGSRAPAAAPPRRTPRRGHRLDAARAAAHAVDGRPRRAVLGELRRSRARRGAARQPDGGAHGDVDRGAGAAADHDAIRDSRLLVGLAFSSRWRSPATS